MGSILNSAEYEAENKEADYVEARRSGLGYTLSDLGWFQAPGNVVFVVIGMLYGEGDFKKSMIIVTNCGDDTDCSADTIGFLFWIIMVVYKSQRQNLQTSWAVD